MRLSSPYLPRGSTAMKHHVVSADDLRPRNHLCCASLTCAIGHSRHAEWESPRRERVTRNNAAAATDANSGRNYPTAVRRRNACEVSGSAVRSCAVSPLQVKYVHACAPLHCNRSQLARDLIVRFLTHQGASPRGRGRRPFVGVKVGAVEPVPPD